MMDDRRTPAISIADEIHKIASERKKSNERWWDFILRPTKDGFLTDATVDLVLREYGIDSFDKYRERTLHRIEGRFDDLDTDGSNAVIQLRGREKQFEQARKLKDELGLSWNEYILLCSSIKFDPISPIAMRDRLEQLIRVGDFDDI
jgi:hypothetical protein